MAQVCGMASTSVTRLPRYPALPSYHRHSRCGRGTFSAPRCPPPSPIMVSHASRDCARSLSAQQSGVFCGGYCRFMAGRPFVWHQRSASGTVCCCARHLSGDLQRDCTFVRGGMAPPPQGGWNRWLLCWSLMDFAGAVGGWRVTCDPCARLRSVRW